MVHRRLQETDMKKYDLSTSDGLMEALRDDIVNYKPPNAIALRDPRTELFQHIFSEYEPFIGDIGDEVYIKTKIWEAISKYAS